MSDEKKDAAAEAATEEKKKFTSAEATEDKETTTEVPASNDDSGSDEEVEVPEKFKTLVESIEQMSVIDLAELVKILEKKFGVSAAAPVAVAAAPGAATGEDTEEKSSFTVELTGIGDNKIGVIKAVREITQKGLKEAKDMVDGAPSVIGEDVKKEEAEEMKKKLEEAGAQVNLK